jgi:hypothetical protein
MVGGGVGFRVNSSLIETLYKTEVTDYLKRIELYSPPIADRNN